MFFRFLAAALALTLTSHSSGAATVYGVSYTATINKDALNAEVSIALSGNVAALKKLEFTFKDGKRYAGWKGDGSVEVGPNKVIWTPKGSAPVLRYVHLIPHARKDGAYDARITPTWALLRGDDLIPPARARTTKGARSQATLKFKLPKGWSAETAWPQKSPELFTINNPRRSFDRPTGWMMLGEIGTRLDRINGTLIAVTGPVGDGPRRQDILAFLNWTLPEYRAAFGELPDKFLIVGAAEKMWRGGLSGPNSFYIHPDRPLISENGTSSLLHELVHTVQRIKAAPRHDWLVEGIAEFYAIEILHRSGGSSPERYARTHEWLRDWGKNVKSIYTSRSTGEITARSVGILKALDDELKRATEGKKGIDDVSRALMRQRERVSLKQLRQITRELAGRDLKALSDAALPGAETSDDQP